MIRINGNTTNTPQANNASNKQCVQSQSYNGNSIFQQTHPPPIKIRKVVHARTTLLSLSVYATTI